MDIFSKTYLKILEEDILTSFSELNPKDFAKSNGNFPEGEDLDITNEFSKYLTDSIHKIILLSHCIKSETETDVHGINYMNISKERFIEVVSKCLKHILTAKTLFKEQDIRFNMNDVKLKQTYSIVITFIPTKLPDEYEVKLKTIFYSPFDKNHDTTIKHNDKGWLKECEKFPMIVENINGLLTFYLTVF